ncbi:RNA-dependent ATPase [Cryomyces antarcticus]|nr:RNA-dependent ATPase [Cryomyces antarcticus]
MAKRLHEETIAENGVAAIDGDVPISKRSRKDKSAKSNGESVLENGEKKSKKDKKRKNLEATSGTDTPQVSGTTDDSESAGVAAVKAAKAERKALKRAKKKAQEAAVAREDVTTTSSEETEVPKEGDNAAAKAAHKAEKTKMKAAKKAARTRNSTDGPSTPLDGTTMDGTSMASSKLQSLEPTPNPESGTASTASGYVEDPALSALPQAEIDSFLSQNFITITDPLSIASTHRPITNFSYLPIKDPAQRAPFALFTTPTPIQAAAWPPVLAGRDVIGVAETGSGKTLAFGVPCIKYITSLPKSQQRKGVRACMVSPTRELAMQIYEQLVKLATPAGLGVVCVYGGVPKDEQRAALKTASIVVATPGRLNDLINENSADLSNVGYVVLDEADRMLDKGFEEEIRKIINTTQATPDRQTLMFTATWPQSVRELAATFMTNPVKIAIGDNPTGELRANTRITQTVEVVDPRGKEQRLLQLLKQHQSGQDKDDRILVFCLYKKEATRIENFLRMKGLKVAGIHGDLSQQQRTASLDAFKQGKVPLLVATDVAARGLDIPAVKMVINVTFPLTVEDYVHRIGRTGRAGKEGKAITLFTEHDKALSGGLVNVLKAANQPVPEGLMKFGTTVKKKGHEAYGAFYKDTGDAPMKKATKIIFD